MNTILHDLNFDHWQAMLLAALPAILNLIIFIYVRIKFPSDKTSNSFSTLLLAIIIFQLGDTFIRMSGTIEIARLVNAIFFIGILFVTPLGLHFCLLFTSNKRFAESFSAQFLLYFPSIIFLMLTFINKDSYQFFPSHFWNWVYMEGPSSLWAFEGYWVGLIGATMLFILIRHAKLVQRNSIKQKQTLIISLGISIPLLQGIITQIILPVFYGYSIPITSSFLTCFSIAILIALSKYKLFSISDSLKTRTILKAMTDILIILNSDKKILFINREGDRTLGTNFSNGGDSRIEDFFYAENNGNELFSSNTFTSILEGNKIENFSTELITKTGKRIPALVSATCYKVGRHESQVLLLIHDISTLIQTKQELAIREQEIKDRSQELNAFFYRTTHDLKGPVASIIALTKMVKEETDPKIANECLDKIDSSALRLNNILLEFIQIMQIKEKTPVLSQIDFLQMINGIVQSLEHTTGSDIVDFKIAVDPEIVFHSDEKLLDSIIYNLVSNAINYRNKRAENNSFVKIQVNNFKNGITLKVVDNGIGIKKEIQDKIFNVFFRGNTDTKGTGLGLYILKNAVTKLKGTIELESELNKGTAFTIFLPDLK